MDKLDTIFEMQDTLNQRIGVVTENLSEEEKTKWVLNYTLSPFRAKLARFGRRRARWLRSRHDAPRAAC